MYCLFGSTKYILETCNAFINIPGGGLRCRLKRGLITLVTVLRKTHCGFLEIPCMGYMGLGANFLYYGIDLF